MKNKKFMKSLFATLLCVATVAVGLPITAKAEEVTDKKWVDWVVTNAEVRHLTDEEAKLIYEDWWGCDVYSDEIYVCNRDTTISINVENSLAKFKDVFGDKIGGDVYRFYVTRNDDTLKFIRENPAFDTYEEYDEFKTSTSDKPNNYRHPYEFLAGQDSERYDMESGQTVPISDYAGLLMCKVVYYNEAGEERFSTLPMVSQETASLLHYKDSNSDASVSNDNTTANYTVDMSSDTTPISAADFSAILSENATKDVVIKSNNGVEFTFAKGTMTAVDGMENYDFGTTLITDYDSAKETTSYVVKDNFVAQVNFNYSGKLPATATIKLPVGREYAGKTLNYSQLQATGIRFVQSAVVDEAGYITVTQDHCSNYVITNPTNDAESSKSDLNSETPSGNADNTTTNNTTNNTTTNNMSTTVAPKTGDNTDTYVWLMLIAASVSAVAVVASKKMKNA